MDLGGPKQLAILQPRPTHVRNSNDLMARKRQQFGSEFVRNVVIEENFHKRRRDPRAKSSRR